MARGLCKRCDACGERMLNGIYRPGHGLQICRDCYNPRPVYPTEPDDFADFDAPPKRKLRLRYHALRLWKAEDLCYMLHIRFERVRTDLLERLLAECGLDTFERFCQLYCRRASS